MRREAEEAAQRDADAKARREAAARREMEATEAAAAEAAAAAAARKAAAAPSRGVPRAVPLNLGNVPSYETREAVKAEEGSLSARRRAGAAGAAATALGGGEQVTFRDATTERFGLEEITSHRATNLNPVCKELYLNDDEFVKTFGCTKDAFYKLRLWKQRELKRAAGLF